MSSDIRSFFGAGASVQATTNRNDESDSSSSESDKEPPPKKQCPKAKKSTAKRRYCKSWEKDFTWLEYDEDNDGAFCQTCKESGKSLQHTGGVWVTKPFRNWKKLVISCGGQDLKTFVETAAKNAVYTSRIAVLDFIEAMGIWVEESILKRLQKAAVYSLMANECTDVSTIEEMSVFCRWEEGGIPVECFLEILPLNKTDAKTIYCSLVDCLKEKNLQISRIVGTGFDGAATFSGKKTGVQARLKVHAPHAIFVHCHCHMLQLACVQAANSTPGIKHVYITLTTLWKYFHYSPKRAESLKEIQHVLGLPEMKIIKPSDTRWLAHERCVKAVKASYSSIAVTLDSNYENLHEPEALGLHRALRKESTIAAIFLLDYILPNVAKLSKALQTQQLDLSLISTLVDATIQTMDDAVLPAANWVLELLDQADDLHTSTGVLMDASKISSFQDSHAKPFVAHLKENISSRFRSSHDVVKALSNSIRGKFQELIQPLSLHMEKSQLIYSLITMAKIELHKR